MRLRLILSFTLIVLVSVSSVAFIARRNTALEVRSFMFHGGMSGLSDLASALEAYHQTYQAWQGVGNLLNSYQTSPGHGMGGPDRPGMMDMMNQRLRVFDAHGVLVADTANPFIPSQLSPADTPRAILLYNGSTLIGYLLPENGNTFSPADQAYLLNRLSQAALSAGVISGGIALLVALLLAYSLARPLRILTEAAGQLARGDLKQRVTVHGNDELANLGKAFNHMAASLQQAEDSRRAMTADIAHELRTPLAVQRAHLEALQDGIYPLIPENLATIQDQNLLLTRLVEDLRTLASAEAGQLTLERIPTNFPALVLRTVERFKPQAETHQIALHLDCSPDALALPDIPLDPQRIEQILSNLLSNALRYTPDSGRIDCQVTIPEHPVQNTSSIKFTIHDSGPGIPPEALPHIFERFYRVDHSRSRTEGGSGLGLTIARQLAEAHGGTLTAENHPGGGAEFTLTIPNS